MQVIVGSRQAGKTHKLIKWLKEDSQRVLICHSLMEARRISRDYGVPADQVLSYSEWGRRRGAPPSGLAIDNLDLVLPILLGGHNVDVVALTGAVRK